MNVTVLGTGIMGAGVARSLLRDKFDVTVWNRNHDKAAPLAEVGAMVATSAADAVRDADIVITTLFDADAVLEVMSGVVDELDESVVWMQASTIGLEGAEQVRELADSHDVALVEAMMLGTRAPAEQGKLVLLVSGDRGHADRLAHVFEAMSSKVVWAGPDVGQATALKLACNAWIASITVATAQSLALVQGLGLHPTLFLDALEGGPTDCAYAHVKGKAMLAGAFAPSFEVDGVIKDVDLIRAAAREAGVDDTLLTSLRGFYARASSDGHGHDDMAAVFTSVRPRIT